MKDHQGGTSGHFVSGELTISVDGHRDRRKDRVVRGTGTNATRRWFDFVGRTKFTLNSKKRNTTETECMKRGNRT